MEFYNIYLQVFVTVLVTGFVSARGVNISNTWMLPEEGFPVFYRYFRDRISWYEADAVCQFHHANLVTADSASQYDAIRAYLKELDITENIWIGLSKTTERPNFTWTNYRLLNGEGHWQQAIPKGNEAICVAMDPVADFLWKPMTCGGPDVASFICELAVPSWAMGPKGCLFTELPSLTVLYIPEQLALELTSDCGLDGTKKISCKGNADREDILKQLTCAMSADDFEDKSTKFPISSNTLPNTLSDLASEDTFVNSKTTKPWIWTSNTIDIDYGMPTRHRRETEDTLSPSSTKSTTDLSTLESRNNNNETEVKHSDSKYDAETTSSTLVDDVTLDMIVSLKSEKVRKDSEIGDLTTKQSKEQTEIVEDVFGTTESKTGDPEIEDTGEYPSAIGQGQLFGIIENGTLFDIIEVNETTSDYLKMTKNAMMETSQSPMNNVKSSTHYNNENLYTTVVYHKEPPSEMNFVTNKSVKKNDNLAKKHTFKEKDSKKANDHPIRKVKTEENKSTNNTLDMSSVKEVEMFPIATDSLVKLNRTFRKEVPSANELDVDNSSKSEDHDNKHQHVEIKWHESGNDVVQMKLFVTTKRADAGQQPSENKKANNIDIFDTSTPGRIETEAEESTILKKEFFPTSLLEDSQNTIIESSTVRPLLGDPVEPEPEAQPRPNRQRQLTRPQRRSFYPYFFSRVLG